MEWMPLLYVADEPRATIGGRAVRCAYVADRSGARERLVVLARVLQRGAQLRCCVLVGFWIRVLRDGVFGPAPPHQGIITNVINTLCLVLFRQGIVFCTAQIDATDAYHVVSDVLSVVGATLQTPHLRATLERLATRLVYGARCHIYNDDHTFYKLYDLSMLRVLPLADKVFSQKLAASDFRTFSELVPQPTDLQAALLGVGRAAVGRMGEISSIAAWTVCALRSQWWMSSLDDPFAGHRVERVMEIAAMPCPAWKVLYITLHRKTKATNPFSVSCGQIN